MTCILHEEKTHLSAMLLLLACRFSLGFGLAAAGAARLNVANGAVPVPQEWLFSQVYLKNMHSFLSVSWNGPSERKWATGGGGKASCCELSIIWSCKRDGWTAGWGSHPALLGSIPADLGHKVSPRCCSCVEGEGALTASLEICSLQHRHLS